MDTILIFVPEEIQGDFSGYLYGIYKSAEPNTCRTFYVLGIFDDDFQSESSPHCDLIGSYCGLRGRFYSDLKTENWILLSRLNDELLIHKVTVEDENVPLELCHVIRYSAQSLVKSEFLATDNPNQSDVDYFETLVYYLKQENEVKSSRRRQPNRFLQAFSTILQLIVNYLNKGNYFTKCTTVGLHLTEHLKNVRWMFETLKNCDKISLQCGNYLSSLIFDMFTGFLVTSLLAQWTKEQEIFDWIASSTEDILTSINLTIKWLMGSPGGLKLNYPLNYILGNFFLYNIYLWWTFLGLVRPLLEAGFFLFLKMGFLGLSFQLALMGDIFSLVSFHLYCIYIYAAKLYHLQVKGIYSLSRIFFGRKKNPEPGKIDSCPYTNEQLFIGTVCFTVLLFLFPTTLVYYIVFMMIRLGATLIGGILTRARYLIEILPIYSSWIWFMSPETVTTTVQLTPIRHISNSGSTTVIASGVTGTWLETTGRCISDVISKPAPVQWNQLLKDILVGKLIYQI